MDQFGAFDEWKNKSFLLLVDGYIGMKDYFQAKSTIEAIEMNVTDEQVKSAARQRVILIEGLEKQEAEKNQRQWVPDEIKIQNENGVQPNEKGGSDE